MGGNCYRSLSAFTAVLTILLVLAPPVSANPGPSYYWFDDMEGDVSEWWSADLTEGASSHFHRDTYLAYEGGYSWWCGTFDYDSDGGYGNSWDDRLEIPPISLTPVAVQNTSWGAIKHIFGEGTPPESAARRDPIYPVLTFAYRHDSEAGYDYTYVQAESAGVYVNLNRGYDGVQAWTDIGPYGYDLSQYDDPLKIRFRFVSDGAWSDEDGLYFSDAGGFHVDNVKVYDFTTGEVLFFDDCESGGGCIPAVPGAAGDYWHLIDRACPAYSDPHSWWCGDDADTSLVPPNLRDALFTPLVYIEGAPSCTCHFATHLAIPTVDNDYVEYRGTVNGVDYYSLGGWWGDFGQCDGWGSTAWNIGFDIGQFGSCMYGGMCFIMNTTDNGCGPGGGGDAGTMIDDFWLVAGYWPVAKQGTPRHWDAAVNGADGHARLFYEIPYGRNR